MSPVNPTVPGGRRRRRRRAPATALALAVTALLGALGTAGPAAADDTGSTVTWSVRPATAADGADRPYFDLRTDPGTVVSDELVVTNYSDEPLDLAFYGTDGFTGSSGDVEALTRDEEPRGLGTWFTAETDALRVEPGQAVPVGFTIDVPENATPGDYVGAVLTSLQVPEGEEGVSVDRRLGARLYLRVEGELRTGLEVTGLTASRPFSLLPVGDATVRYTVTNTGNVRLGADQAVTVTGPWGLLPVTGTGADAVPELLPGESWDVEVAVGGTWSLVRLTAEVDLVPQTTASLPGPPDLVHTRAGFWAVPWLLLVVLLGAVVVVLVVRHRRRVAARRKDAEVRQAVDAALRRHRLAGDPLPDPETPAGGTTGRRAG